jgi:ribosomal protein S18 acetylase RimI-like enzyme
MIVEITEAHRNVLRSLFIREWGSCDMVSRGEIHQMDQLPGFLFMKDECIKGIITYHVADNECEIVSLDSFEENIGIGSQLLEKVIDQSVKHGWKLWLITTNDNTRALHFYQKRGFDMTNVYWNAVDLARKMKPEIPLQTEDGIPIKHEIELTYVPSK